MNEDCVSGEFKGFYLYLFVRFGIRRKQDKVILSWWQISEHLI